MNYPVWETTFTSGGLIIAIIAIVHVYVAHFSVGGGLFLVWTEAKAYRENDPQMLHFISRHTRFFLLITLVFGALTGVGIWSAISAVHPGATSVLIHTFVFAWATEWVFFFVEIISLLIYYYTFYKMRPQAHLTIGWIYFIAAWLSLFIINGILSFMFTPGDWPETKGFWSALFNPSFWPSLLFRTAMALILAGIYGLVTASRLQEPNFRQKMVRYCAIWLVAPFVILAPSAWWYLESIPLDAQAMILGQSQDVMTFTRTYLILSPLLCIGGLLAAIRLPQGLQKALAAVILIIGLVYMGSFEYVRETGRRPYVIYGYMYSNGLTKAHMPEVEQQGVLKYAKWSRIKEVTPENLKDAGQELFRLLCISCHSVGGLRNDILIHVKGKNLPNLEQIIYDMGTSYPQMPPFPGTSIERATLARYLGTIRK